MGFAPRVALEERPWFQRFDPSRDGWAVTGTAFDATKVEACIERDASLRR
jgi:hypothetical protein